MVLGGCGLVAGDGYRVGTDDKPVFREICYPGVTPSKKPDSALPESGFFYSLNQRVIGGRGWVRTSDPCRVKAVLSH